MKNNRKRCGRGRRRQERKEGKDNKKGRRGNWQKGRLGGKEDKIEERGKIIAKKVKVNRRLEGETKTAERGRGDGKKLGK